MKKYENFIKENTNTIAESIIDQNINVVKTYLEKMSKI